TPHLVCLRAPNPASSSRGVARAAANRGPISGRVADFYHWTLAQRNDPSASITQSGSAVRICHLDAGSVSARFRHLSRSAAARSVDSATPTDGRSGADHRLALGRGNGHGLPRFPLIFSCILLSASWSTHLPGSCSF